MYSQKSAALLLERYNPTDVSEIEAKSVILAFIRQHSEYWSRATQTGHLTASAWITNTEQDKAVLLHHKKLDIWVQPGGHIEQNDESLMSASLREAQEETGLKNLTFSNSDIFDIDIHAIPARKNEPEHFHFDVRFWLVAQNMDLQISEESNELAWLTRREIEEKTDEESVLRMVRKSLV